MNSFLNKRKKTVAVFWLISYLLLLIIPIFANAYILMSVNTAIKREIKLKYSYFLESMCADIDHNLRDINSLSYAVRELDSVKELSGKSRITPESLYELKRTAGDVSKTRSGYNNSVDVFCVFVYFPRLDMIVCNNSYFETRDFFENRRVSAGISYEEHKEVLKTDKPIVRKLDYVNEAGKECTVYRFIFPAVKGRSAVVCLDIDEKMLFDRTIDVENNDVVILSGGDNIYISTNDKINEDELSWVKNTKETDIVYKKLAGKNAELSYIRSEVFDSYKYVFVDRTKSLYETSKKLMAVGMSVSVLAILLMLAVLYRLYGWNYLNIKDILTTLGVPSDEKTESLNEFEIIKNRIVSSQGKQRAMEREIYSKYKTQKEEFVLEMLTGVSGENENAVLEGLKKYDIRFDGGCYFVSCIKVRDLGVLEDLGLKNAHYVVRNIMDDVLKNENYCTCEYNGLLFYIFNFSEKENAKEYLSSILTESCEVTKMATEIVFTSATSEEGSSIKDFPKLYESAVNVLDISEFYGMEEHIFRQDLRDNVMEHTPLYSANVENEIILSIKSGDKKQLFEIVDKLFNEYVLVNHEWVFMGLAYSILNSILKVIDMSDSGKTGEAFKMLNSFKDYDNIEKIKGFIKDYGVHAMEIFSSEKEEKNELYESAIEYINEHYTESDLNVAKVSEYLGVTSIYLAYIVKQNSGVKLSEYIAKLRIDKAKSLLGSNAEMRVEDVARLSGFWQNRTFYNTFKKYTGLTPTQYRMLESGKNGNTKA